MEKKIRQTASRIRWAFILFWLLPVLLVVWGECNETCTGMYAGDVRFTYWMETLTILLAAACVPASLKLFSWVLVRKVNPASISRALPLYALWSIVRLALLALPVLVGFVTYYLSFSTKGMLCALIALTASFFCMPGEARLRKELHID